MGVWRVGWLRKGGVGFDFNDEVREIVCRTVKLDQTRKKQDLRLMISMVLINNNNIFD